MELRERITQFRAENNLSQEKFAKMCNVSRMTIFMIEKYNASTTALTRAKIELVVGKE